MTKSLKVGRPRTYKAEYCQIMFDMMKNLGALDCEVFSELGISKDTFYRWLNEYPDFKQAHDLGLPECEKWWTTEMRKRFLAGEDKGFKYCIAIMNNKFAWEKGSKSNGDTTNIHIGNMNILQQKSREGLLEFIKDKISKNSDIIDVQIIETPLVEIKSDGSK